MADRSYPLTQFRLIEPGDGSAEYITAKAGTRTVRIPASWEVDDAEQLAGAISLRILTYLRSKTDDPAGQILLFTSKINSTNTDRLRKAMGLNEYGEQILFPDPAIWQSEIYSLYEAFRSTTYLQSEKE